MVKNLLWHFLLILISKHATQLKETRKRTLKINKNLVYEWGNSRTILLRRITETKKRFDYIMTLIMFSNSQVSLYIGAHHVWNLGKMYL